LPFSLWLTFLTLFFVVPTAISAFSCEEFDNGHGYLRSDYSVICWTSNSDHRVFTTEYQQITVVATGALLIYSLGVPAAYALLLFTKRRTKLHDKMQFLTADYTLQFFYWELIEALKKVLLVSFLAFPS
jgi:hypothetical protein